MEYSTWMTATTTSASAPPRNLKSKQLYSLSLPKNQPPITVSLSFFPLNRDHILEFLPPEGEFPLLHYRISSLMNYHLPFRIVSSIEEGVEGQSNRLDIYIRVRNE